MAIIFFPQLLFSFHFRCNWDEIIYLLFLTSITAPQDAHTSQYCRFFLARRHQSSVLYVQVQIHCYLATKCLLKQKVLEIRVLCQKAFKFRTCGFLIKSFTLKGRAIHQLINRDSKASFHTHALHAYYQPHSIHVAMISYIEY